LYIALNGKCKEQFRPIAGGILLLAILSVIYNIYAVVIKKGKASLEEIE